jgi:hypothetical protein
MVSFIGSPPWIVKPGYNHIYVSRLETRVAKNRLTIADAMRLRFGVGPFGPCEMASLILKLFKISCG